MSKIKMIVEKFKQVWEIHQKWITKLFLILSIPASGIIVYLSILESKGNYYYSSSQDLPNQFIQGISCPSLMSINKPAEVYVTVHNTFPETKPNLTISIIADNFTLIHPKETSMIEEKMSNNSFSSPGWWVAPIQAGKQTITISAVSEDGVSNIAKCETSVWTLDIDVISSSCFAIISAGILFGSNLFQKKRKEKELLKQTAG